mgnify:CR=1 FL=1
MLFGVLPDSNNFIRLGYRLAFNPRITAEVNPESSISFNPLMVIPPGVVTLSISASGLLLFSNSRSIAPFTV